MTPNFIVISEYWKKEKNCFSKRLNCKLFSFFFAFSSLPSTSKSAAKEHVEEIHGTMKSASASWATLFNGIFTALVVDLSLLCIGQNFICHWDLFEFFALIWILKLKLKAVKFPVKKILWCNCRTLSGWYFNASFRYAFFRSSPEQLGLTPTKARSISVKFVINRIRSSGNLRTYPKDHNNPSLSPF